YYYWPYNIVLTAQTYVILYMILLTAYIITILGEVNVLKIKSNQITNGEYEKEVKDNQMIILKDIEKNIINIEDGLRESVSKAIKSERMKSELITNVSHDLKTPLTSIINYVGLLKEENLSQEKRDKYI
ncbi:sensor histidine kinase, partial [Clostridium perfringens]|nr:sensor histidine kinase [Clostridium perfringens]